MEVPVAYEMIHGVASVLILYSCGGRPVDLFSPLLVRGEDHILRSAAEGLGRPSFDGSIAANEEGALCLLEMVVHVRTEQSE